MANLRIGLKYWRKPLRNAVFILFIIELLLNITGLVLFGIADPNTYRSKLWQDGADNGFNSSPNQPLFDLVNGGSYDVPLVWSSFITHFSLIVVVLTLFVMLAKSLMHIMRVLFPIISIFIHGAEFAIWMYSLYGQTAPDTIDPDHKNPGPPWYITKSCSVAKNPNNVHYCLQAKASFFVTVFYVALLGIQIILAVTAIFFAPSPAQVEAELDAFIEIKNQKSNEKSRFAGKDNEPEPQWEMVPIPQTPRNMPMSPMTPRTKAFSALNGPGRL